jgi:hypothetical protein
MPNLVKRGCRLGRWNRLATLGGLVLLVCFLSTRLRASSLTFDYDINGQPGLQAVFSDTSGGVTLTFSALTSGDEVNSLYFNFNPSLSASSLVFTPMQADGSTFSGSTIQTGMDAFKVDGGGKYDIKFSFPDGAITGGNSLTFDITGITGLTAGDFNYLSTPTIGANGPSESSAILVDGGGNPVVVLDESTFDGSDSTVPDEFATVALLGLSFAGLEIVRRMKRAAFANALWSSSSSNR